MTSVIHCSNILPDRICKTSWLMYYKVALIWYCTIVMYYIIIGVHALLGILLLV